MDYPARERLKIIGHARTLSLDESPAMLPHLARPEDAVIERIVEIRVVGFDWNCPQHITPRFTADEVTEATQPLRDRINELESKLASLRTATNSRSVS
jgi:hypothetical protein